jgi:hypothetical protein
MAESIHSSKRAAWNVAVKDHAIQAGKDLIRKIEKGRMN